MRKLAATVFICLLLSAIVFGQSTSATVSGTVSDSSDALIPGVTVTATNDGTGVMTSIVSNEAGAYTFASLVPGTYRVSAALPGFQTRTFTAVELGNATRLRLNFVLQVATQTTSVEVSIAADSILAISSSSVGEILTQQRVQDLPTVSNNVLDLYRLMPGIRVNDDGVSGSFAGLSGTGNRQRATRWCRRRRWIAMGLQCPVGHLYEPGPDRRSETDRRPGRRRTGTRQRPGSVPDAIRHQPISRVGRLVRAQQRARRQHLEQQPASRSEDRCLETDYTRLEQQSSINRQHWRPDRPRTRRSSSYYGIAPWSMDARVPTRWS